MPTTTPQILPTQAELRRLLAYKADTGQLIRKVRPRHEFKTGRDRNAWNTRFAGKIAGYARRDGYITVKINKVGSLAHRLIWTMINGPIPDGLQIDHINGNRSDNRLENLRLVTHAENQRNQKGRSDTTSGICGVGWSKSQNTWLARAGRKHIGFFSSKELAAEAVSTYRRDNGYSERHGSIETNGLTPPSQA